MSANICATTTSGRATFSFSKLPFPAERNKAESELNVECLILSDVETICVKGRAGSICAIYSVAVGIEKEDEGHEEGRS